MPFLYFGLVPRNQGATKLAVRTTQGEMEPVEPSRLKIFPQVQFTPLWSLVTNLLGLLVSVLSYPKYTYIHYTAKGLMVRPAKTTLPFKDPNLAIVLKKGASLSTELSRDLDERGGTAMQFAGRTIYLIEQAGADDFLFADKISEVDPHGPAPARYLNTSSFRAWLVLRSLTTRICEATDVLAASGGDIDEARQRDKSKTTKWRNAQDIEDGSDTVVDAPPEIDYTDKTAFKTDSYVDRTIAPLMSFTMSASGIGYSGSGAVCNSLDVNYDGMLSTSEPKSITSPGVIAKFHPRLALPDPNLIGDVIGRHFLASLGDTYEEQADNLEVLKTGLAALRLTRLGDELTHLYKCLDVAIASYSGCVPIFSNGRSYEGCLIAGGPTATLLINGVSHPFLPVETLRAELLLVSDHQAALNIIISYFPAGDQGAVRDGVDSMYDLRSYCLDLEVTQDQREQITRQAERLDFGSDPWVLNPANLKNCFALMSNFTTLDSSYPIGRFALFSKDPVLVALSCFGEKTAPSWEIPNGTPCSLKKATPPVPPLSAAHRSRGSRGEISDAAWVMVVRRTDLFSAVEEFRRMGETLVYRSTSSSLAKRVGHRVFSRDKMGEFWASMRDALRMVNPNAQLEGVAVLKRGATDVARDDLEEGEIAPKKRRMDF